MKPILRQSITAVRNFRLYSLINIIGLGLALACVMFFAMFVHQEWTADTFHTQLDRICCVTSADPTQMTARNLTEYKQGELEDGASFTYAGLPEIALYTNVVSSYDELSFLDQSLTLEKPLAKVLSTDSSFLRIFDFPVRVGDRDRLLRTPKTAVVTKRFVDRVLPGHNPIGQQFQWNDLVITIEGIMDESPYVSLLDYDVIINVQDVAVTSRHMGIDFILLTDAHQLASLNAKMQVKRTFKYVFGNQELIYGVEPLKGLYLNASYGRPSGFLTGHKENTLVLALAALLVLVVGLFNYVNIQSVITLKRGKELGVKKVFGASAGTMYLQFYLEHFTAVCISAVLAFFLTEGFRLLALSWLGIDIHHVWAFDLLLLGIIVFAIPLATALIPYVKYRYSLPVNTMKSLGNTPGGRSARHLFICLQNIMSVVMLVSALFFIRQLQTMLKADLGFTTDHLMVVDPILRPASMDSQQDKATQKEKREQAANHFSLLKNELSKTPDVEAFCLGNKLISDEYIHEEFRFQNDTYRSVILLRGSGPYVNTYGLELVDGAFFGAYEGDPADRWSGNEMVVPQGALKLFGISDWRSAILESKEALWYSFDYNTGRIVDGDKNYRIVGVIKDIRPEKLTHPSAPVVFLYADEKPQEFITIRHQPGRQQQVYRVLEKLSENTTQSQVVFTTMEDQLRTRYTEERRVATTYSLFAFLAILISSLGLFGLSYFDVQQRYREIALRKVNGATTHDVMGLLLNKYLRLLAISFVIAVPLSWLALHFYTRSFLTRAPLSWWLFALAIAITTAISLLTLWWQTSQAARENPAKAMKAE